MLSGCSGHQALARCLTECSSQQCVPVGSSHAGPEVMVPAGSLYLKNTCVGALLGPGSPRGQPLISLISGTELPQERAFRTFQLHEIF